MRLTLIYDMIDMRTTLIWDLIVWSLFCSLNFKNFHHLHQPQNFAYLPTPPTKKKYKKSHYVFLKLSITAWIYFSTFIQQKLISEINVLQRTDNFICESVLILAFAFLKTATEVNDDFCSGDC